MQKEIIHLSDIPSTNDYLMSLPTPAPDAMTIAVASHQTAGRGQGSNKWESEDGKNLLFSILTSPVSVPIAKQFVLSMAGALALKHVLDRYTKDITLKWPNDIYWRNAKICGMLIENRLKGMQICDSIAGIGINVNQREFQSDAPNPISLWQITGQETNRQALLEDIICRIESYMLQDVRERYMQALYRRKGLHPYCDAQGAFMARIEDVEEDGHLVLMTEDGERRRYAFKEVSFVI